MDKNITIKKTEKKDFNYIFPLFHQLWPNKILNENDLRIVFERGLESSTDQYFSADINGEVVGFYAHAIINNFWQEGYIAYAYTLIVEENLRGMGIGKALLEEAIKKARLLNCKRLELDSAFHREKAHKFYENFGFEKRAFLFSYDLKA